MYIDGGRILSADGKKFVQNSPEGVSALQKLADLALVHKVTPPDFGTVDQAGVRAQFKDRKTVAMLMSTPGFIPDLEKENFPLAVVPPPVGKLGKTVTNGAFGLYAVVKRAIKDTLKAAHELAKYLTGSQVAKDIPGWQLAPGLRKSNTGYATNAIARDDRQAGRVRRVRSAGGDLGRTGQPVRRGAPGHHPGQADRQAGDG